MPSCCGAMFLVKQGIPTGTVGLYWETLLLCHHQQLLEKEPQSLSACGLTQCNKMCLQERDPALVNFIHPPHKWQSPSWSSWAPFVVNRGEGWVGGKNTFGTRFISLILDLFQDEMNHILKDLYREPRVTNAEVNTYMTDTVKRQWLQCIVCHSNLMEDEHGFCPSL